MPRVNMNGPSMREALALFLAGVLAAPQFAVAATRTWASGAGNWNAAASWSGSVAPVAGDDAAISGGTVTLTNTTPWLGSFTNSGTLIFTGNDGFGTNVALTATNVTILAGGRITHATNATYSTNAAGVWAPSNRVWIVCSNSGCSRRRCRVGRSS